MSRYQAELRYEVDAISGESPYWDTPTCDFWWIDFHGGQLFRVPSGADAPRVTRLDRYFGSFAPVEGSDTLLANTRNGFTELGPGWAEEITIDYEAAIDTNSLNDGKCDPRGRMWVGSMSREPGVASGRLYCLTSDRRVVELAGDIQISNGIGWSPDGTTFYLVDTAAHTIEAFDCDLDGPSLSNRRVIATIPDEIGIPDGLAVDSEGYIWVAICFGGVVHRYSPDGELDSVVEVPVPMATSVAFGGPELRTLYVTTGRIRDIPIATSRGFRPDAHQPGAACLYTCEVDVAGLPMNRFVSA